MSESENPVIPSPTPKQTRPRTNKDWWPNQLDLSVLHQHSSLSNPMEPDFNYAEEFKKLDLEALRQKVARFQHADPEIVVRRWRLGPPGLRSRAQYRIRERSAHIDAEAKVAGQLLRHCAAFVQWSGSDANERPVPTGTTSTNSARPSTGSR